MKQALLKLHLAVFLWGFTGILGKAISLNEGMLVWYRILITLISLFIFQKWIGKIKKLPKKTALPIAGSGAILAIHWCFFYGSIKYSNVSIALICLSSSGLFSSLLAPIFNKTRVAIQEVLLGILGIVGIYIIFHFDPHYQTGILLGLIAALLSCIYTIFSEKQVAGHSSQTVLLYQLLGGFILLTAIMPLYLRYLPSGSAKSLLPIGYDWLLLLVMSWFCTIISMNLSLQSLKHLSAFTQNLTINMEPVYGILFAFLIYKENQHLSSNFFIGFALIALAVALQMIRIIGGINKPIENLH